MTTSSAPDAGSPRKDAAGRSATAPGQGDQRQEGAEPIRRGLESRPARPPAPVSPGEAQPAEVPQGQAPPSEGASREGPAGEGPAEGSRTDCAGRRAPSGAGYGRLDGLTRVLCPLLVTLAGLHLGGFTLSLEPLTSWWLRVLGAVAILLVGTGVFVLGRVRVIARSPRATPRPLHGANVRGWPIGDGDPESETHKLREATALPYFLLAFLLAMLPMAMPDVDERVALAVESREWSVLAGASALVLVIYGSALALTLKMLARTHQLAVDHPGSSRSDAALRAAAIFVQRWMLPGPEDPRDPAWAGDPRSWNTRLGLHWIATCYLIAVVLYAIALSWDSSVPVPVLGGVVILGGETAVAAVAFVYVALLPVLSLHRALIQAVKVTPTQVGARAEWRDSRDRAMSLARVRSDSRTLLVLYTVLFIAVLVLEFLRWVSTPDGRTSGTPLSGGLVTIYGPLLLALLSVGTLPYVRSAWKEVTVMQADADHRDPTTA